MFCVKRVFHPNVLLLDYSTLLPSGEAQCTVKKPKFILPIIPISLGNRAGGSGWAVWTFYSFNSLKKKKYLSTMLDYWHLKFIYSEKATKFCEIFPLILTVCTVVKIKGKISQNFAAFSEYMNFNVLYY